MKMKRIIVLGKSTQQVSYSYIKHLNIKERKFLILTHLLVTYSHNIILYCKNNCQ